MIFFKKEPLPPFTIAITTFQHRFDRYFMPLVKQLREYDSESEILVAVNGEHRQDFDETFRQRLMAFLATTPRVYPIFFPQFRGLAKLWNTLIVHASHDHILLLNDDLMIEAPDFREAVARAIVKNGQRSFVINDSWSHCVMSRAEIDALGYFDERLLGIGEEDGDMVWRYQKHFARPVARVKVKGFTNFAEETMAGRPTNIRNRGESKYSQFNRDFMFGDKYQPDPAGLRGIFDEPVALVDPSPPLYPQEAFFHRRRNEL